MKIKFVQKLIDKCRNKIPYEHFIDIWATKILTLESILPQINTLILGSSHAQLGYIANKDEFNLGVSFQDLHYSYQLFLKYAPLNIKNIILFYSVFSPGNQRIKTKFAHLCGLFKSVGNLDYQEVKPEQRKYFQKLEKIYLKQFDKFKKHFIYDEKYRGNETSYITCFKPPKAELRALDHLKENYRFTNQTEYVEKMLELARKHKINFTILLSPATKEYKEALPKSNILFRDLFQLVQNTPIKVINLYDSELFLDSDFVDWDHLNKQGAEKLTNYVRNIYTQQEGHDDKIHI